MEILDVQFLTPARVLVKNQDGHEAEVSVSIDLANRKVYPVEMQEAVFQFLDSASPLPEDFFTASDDIYEKVHETVDEMQENKEAHVGDDDGRRSTDD